MAEWACVIPLGTYDSLASNPDYLAAMLPVIRDIAAERAAAAGVTLRRNSEQIIHETIPVSFEDPETGDLTEVPPMMAIRFSGWAPEPAG